MSDFNELLSHIQQELKELEEAAGEDQKKWLLVLAEKIKCYRAENKLTQEELAKKLYVSKMAVISWEKGEVMPIASNLARFRELGIIEK